MSRALEIDLLCEYLDDSYPCDEEGSMSQKTSNPRFLLVRTPDLTFWRLRADLSREVVKALARLAGREPRLEGQPGETPPPERLESLCRILYPGEAPRTWRRLLYAIAPDSADVIPIELEEAGREGVGRVLAEAYRFD